ncbi:MAG TPA: pyrimidine dimer DNA glycosylase/endonuclease V [Gemmatimonadales bacterium]
MRLWTVHPMYLDSRGLVALWREGLLARAVLRGETRGYRHHPQLQRFLTHPVPLDAIDAYLGAVLEEAARRGYAFDRGKVGPVRDEVGKVGSTAGQLAYEWRHLLRKLEVRSPAVYERWRGVATPEPHPLFAIGEGPVEGWERAVDGA